MKVIDKTVSSESLLTDLGISQLTHLITVNDDGQQHNQAGMDKLLNKVSLYLLNLILLKYI